MSGKRARKITMTSSGGKSVTSRTSREVTLEESARFTKKIRDTHIQYMALRFLAMSPILAGAVWFIGFLIGLVIGLS